MFSDQPAPYHRRKAPPHWAESAIRAAFFLFPILFVIQNPTFQEIDQLWLKPYHLFTAGLFALSAYRAPRNAMLVFVAWISLFVAVALLSGIGEINTRFLNALGFGMAFLGAAGASVRDRQSARKGAVVAAAILALTTLWQLPTIISTSAINAEGRALYPTIMAGGINIQASTFIILYVWVVGGSFISVTAALVVTYLLTQTRAIFLAIPATLVYQHSLKTRETHTIRNVLIVGFSMIAITTALSLDLFELSKLTSRFYALSSGDAGTSGRILLYHVAFSNPDCYAIGCGPGSAAQMISSSGFFDLYEDNFHNVYLQMVVEAGVIGVLLYTGMMIWAYTRARSYLNEHGLALAILLVALMSLVEFNGLEYITAFLIGLGFSNAPNFTHDRRLREP